MNIYILRRKGSGIATCRGIGQNMPKLTKVINEHKIRRILRLRRNPDILIRWGCLAPLNGRIEINSPEVINLVNDKISSRKLLFENGVSVPKTYFSKQQIIDSNPNFPLIGRKKYHSQGLGMNISENRQNIINDRKSEYWSEYIKKDREFRIFVFFGKILGVCEKIPNNPDAISWNNSLNNGIFKTLKKREFPLPACFLALKAAKILNVDFSAVDIISKGDKNYVLELNNAPTCSDYRQLLFSRAFNWLIEKVEELNVKPPHFELPNNVRRFKQIVHPCLLNLAE